MVKQVLYIDGLPPSYDTILHYIVLHDCPDTFLSFVLVNSVICLYSGDSFVTLKSTHTPCSSYSMHSLTHHSYIDLDSCHIRKHKVCLKARTLRLFEMDFRHFGESRAVGRRA